MFKSKKHDKRLDVFREMPELVHSKPGEDFDLEKSEVIGWIRQHPELLDYLKDSARYKGLIEYKDGRWRGVKE